MSGWQPIETAPKGDGASWGPTLILFRVRSDGSKEVYVGHYNHDAYARREKRPFWESSPSLFGKGFDRANPPTHWHPFPDPPEQQP